MEEKRREEIDWFRQEELERFRHEEQPRAVAREEELERIRLRDREEAEHREERKRKEKLMEGYPKCKSLDSLEIWLDNLLHALLEAEILERDWTVYMRSGLMGKYAELLYSLQLPGKCTLEMARTRLLQCAEYCKAKAGNKLFNTSRRDLQRMTAMNFFLHFERIVKSILAGVETMEECAHFITSAAVRNYLCADGKFYYDTRDIRSQSDIRETLHTYRE